MKSWEWNPKLWVFKKKVCGCILIGNSLRKKLSHHTKTKRFNLFVISKVAASFIGFLHYCIMRNFFHKKFLPLCLTLTYHGNGDTWFLCEKNRKHTTLCNIEDQLLSRKLPMNEIHSMNQDVCLLPITSCGL